MATDIYAFSDKTSGNTIQAEDASWTKDGAATANAIISTTATKRSRSSGALSNSFAAYALPARAGDNHKIEADFYRAGTPGNTNCNLQILLHAGAGLTTGYSLLFNLLINKFRCYRNGSLLFTDSVTRTTADAVLGHGSITYINGTVVWAIDGTPIYSYVDGTPVTGGNPAYGTYERHSDANGFHLGDVTVTDLNPTAGGPNLVSAEIDSTGKNLVLTFDDDATYFAGQATVNATPRLGQTAARFSKTKLTNPSGNGTTVLTFALNDGRPIIDLETGITVDLPEHFVVDATFSLGSPAYTGEAVTNSSAYAAVPSVRFTQRSYRKHSSGTFDVEVDAHSNFGIASVYIEVTDGVNTETATATVRSASAGSYTYGLDKTPAYYIGTFNVADFTAGMVTITATATDDLGATNEVEQDIIVGATTATTYTVRADGAGGAYTSIQAALTAARIAGTEEAILDITEAGTYDPTGGWAGVDYTPTRGVIIQRGAGLALGDVVLQTDAASIRPHAYPLTYQGIKMQLSQIGDVEQIVTVYSGIFYQSEICHLNPRPASSPSAVWNVSSESYQLEDCLIHDTMVCVTYAALCRNVTCQDYGADFMDNCLAIFNCKSVRRSAGKPCFTIQYTGAGASATIQKTGDIGSGNLVLIDSVNGTTSLTLSSYADIDALVAAIVAVTGWTATNIIDGYEWPTTSFYPTLAKDAKTAEVTVYQPTSYHSDLLQWFSAAAFPAFENVIVNGVECEELDATEYFGCSTDMQVFWLDHANTGMKTFAIVNVAGPTFAGVTTPNSTNRSGMMSRLEDGLFAYNTTPHTNLNLINNAGSSVEFKPVNLVVAYSVFKTMEAENESASFNHNEVELIDLHFATSSVSVVSGDVTGGAGLTVGDIADEVEDLSIATLDLTPISGGNLLLRVPLAVDVADIDGTARGASGAIGPYSLTTTAPTVTTATPASVTTTTASLGGEVTDDGGATVTERGVCYNTTGTPTTSDTKNANGSGTGTFSETSSGLTAGTSYYVRAYAINSVGTAYGSEQTFTTDEEDIVIGGGVSVVPSTAIGRLGIGL